MTMGLAERALGLEQFCADVTFDDDLCVGWNQEINGLRTDDVDRPAGESTSDFEFIEITNVGTATIE
jgi:hypothetical protein